jgi:hypothetical protein
MHRRRASADIRYHGAFHILLSCVAASATTRSTLDWLPADGLERYPPGR